MIAPATPYFQTFLRPSCCYLYCVYNVKNLDILYCCMFLGKQKTTKKYVKNMMKSKINKYQYYCKLIICVDYI